MDEVELKLVGPKGEVTSLVYSQEEYDEIVTIALQDFLKNAIDAYCKTIEKDLEE